MKKRHPAAVLLLPIVTLGIYCIYWLYATRKEILAQMGSKNAIPPVFVLFLPIILFIGLIIIGITAGGDTAATATTEDTSIDVVGVITIIITIAFFIAGVMLLPLWWFWKYCKAAVQVTKGRGMDFTQLYVLYVVIVWLCSIAPVWMLIAQLDFNKVATGDGHHPQGRGTHPASASEESAA